MFMSKQAHTHTHTHTKMKMVNDSPYAWWVWMGSMKWQCVTPTVQQSIKRFDGASVWRAQEQQAEQEWKCGPDSLHIVIPLQIITRNRHNMEKSSLHKWNTYRIKQTHYGIWTCFINASYTITKWNSCHKCIACERVTVCVCKQKEEEGKELWTDIYLDESSHHSVITWPYPDILWLWVPDNDRASVCDMEESILWREASSVLLQAEFENNSSRMWGTI